MSSHNVREAAFILLQEILEGKAGGGEWTSHRVFVSLPAEKRSECLNLILTALRQRGCIDALLAARMTREPRGAQRAVLHLLHLGVAELLWLGTPAYAAVHSYVELSKRLGFKPLSGMVNAILKRIAQTGKEELAGLDAVRLNTPPWLWSRWVAAYGEEATRRMAALHGQEPPLDLTLMPEQDREAWAHALEAELLPTGSLRRRKTGKIPELPGYEEGMWWVQDASAALPVMLMGKVAGLRALDMCAAPGGKAAQLAAGGAQVVALDRSASRLKRMRENLDRLHLASSVQLVETDALAYSSDAPFDRVLLDAPCSATGTVRRHPEVAWRRTQQEIARLAQAQAALLRHAARVCAPGGIMVYSVCSLEPEEGEQQIDAFLRAHPEFSILPADTQSTGIPSAWFNAEGCLRVLPCFFEEHGGMDGFFAAAMQRHHDSI